MKPLKKDQRFHIKMTVEEYSTLKQLSENSNLPMGQYLINSGLNNTGNNPLYTKNVHSFMLHLEALQKILEQQSDTDLETQKLRSQLNQEAKKLWQSLKL